MIRIGFGVTNISVGFGTDLSFKAIIKGIRIAIGTGVITRNGAEIIVRVKARANVPLIKATQNSQKLNSLKLKLKDRTQSSIKRM
jgi:hypothetical protein